MKPKKMKYSLKAQATKVDVFKVKQKVQICMLISIQQISIQIIDLNHLNQELFAKIIIFLQQETKMETKQNLRIKKVPKKQAGRWAKKEHQLFLKGLSQFGKDWKKIKGLVPSRSLTQIRSHAQKYFIRMQNQQYNSQDEYSEIESDSEYTLKYKNMKQEHDKSADVTEMHGNQDIHPFFTFPKIQDTYNFEQENGHRKMGEIQQEKHSEVQIEQNPTTKQVGFIACSTKPQMNNTSFFNQILNNYYKAIILGQFLQLVDIPNPGN